MGQPGLALGITIEKANPSHLAELISIHRTALPDTFNSRLGTQHLTFLYTRLLAHPRSILAAARLDGRLSGLVCATLNVEGLSHWLTAELTPSGWARYALSILARPALWLPALEALGSSQAVRLEGVSIPACLTVLAVDPLARRRGLGQALVRTVDDFVSKAGLFRYFLETDIHNQGAIDFYSRLGFTALGRRGPSLQLVRRLEPDGAACRS